VLLAEFSRYSMAEAIASFLFLHFHLGETVTKQSLWK